MTIPASANPLLLASAAAAPTGYNIERSLRFNSSDSAYLSKNFASAGNRKTWTWAGWVKRSKLGTGHLFVGYVTGNDNQILEFRFSSDKLHVALWTINLRVTTQVFRDIGAWAHVVLAVDTTQTIANDRVKLYWNGAQITQFDTTNNPAQNADLGVNQAGLHTIGREWTGGVTLNGYLADIHFIDGQALDPTSFTEVSATTGQLIPKAYTGTYGTNGFHLDFADNSTAAALGTDTSGNSNTWTVNNISVAAGSGNDSLVDTPTSYGTDTGAGGGEVRGNYATLNPLAGTGTLANGNLECSGQFYRTGTIGLSSGKYYWEIIIGSVVTNSWIGLYLDSGNSGGNFVITGPFARYSNAGGTFSVTSASLTQGDIIGVAADFDSGTITWRKNNSVAVQLTGATLNTNTWFVGAHVNASASVAWVFNFGQRPFAYTAPSGFKALCDSNIAEGSITTSGSFTGNANADGPFIWLNGVPTAMTINSNAVTFGTHADKLANGFKLRTSSTSYNTSGSNTYSITTTGAKFKYARAQANP